MTGSGFGRHDDSLDLIYPEDRAQFRRHILAGGFARRSMETRLRAARPISYMETLKVSMRNDDSCRHLTNDRVGAPTLRKLRVDELIGKGTLRWKERRTACLSALKGPAAEPKWRI